MVKWLLGLLLLTHATAALSQELAFPGDPATGTAIEAALPALARDALGAYREEDRDRYLDTAFRLQMAAGRYQETISTLRTLRALRATPADGQTSLFVQYEIFAQAKILQAAQSLSFADAYRKAFAEVYGKLDDRSAHRVLFSFGTSMPRLRGEFDTAVARQRGHATIALPDALLLLRKYQVLEAYAAFAPLVDALVAEDDQRRYVIDRNVLVKTPSGAAIAAMVVRPRQAGPLPALFQFTIYANDDWAFADAKKTAAYGYAGVVAYTRGKGRSPETIVPFEHDGEDAAAVIDWIARQAWNDGRVGMYGGSYSGFTQWAAAKRRPKALKAMATSATTAPGIDVPMEGNVFLNFMYPWPFYTTGNQSLDDATYGDHARWDALNRNWYRSGGAYRSLPAIDGAPNPVFLRWLQHPGYDRYWQRMIPQGKQFSGIGIPVLATTGYFDGAQVGVLHYLTEHLRHRPDADHTLLIGPYEHFTMQTGVARTVQGYEIDPVATVDLQELRLQWFDHIFKNAPKPALLQDRINYQVMGANVWKHAASLQAMGNDTLRLYLAPGESAGSHRLAAEPAREGSVRQRVDWRDRSDAAWTTPPDALNKTLDPHGSLVFASEPLGKDTELSGLISGSLDFTVNKRDLDITVTLYEQMPDGQYLQLAYWMRRASYSHDRRHRRLLVPGVRQRIDFVSERLTSRKLQPGSRLVIVLGTNKQPDLQINYGTGKEVSDETVADAGEPLAIDWHAGSYIELPVWR